MNKQAELQHHEPSSEQAARLRQIVADIVYCCHERVEHESRLMGLPPTELKTLMLFLDERYLTSAGLASRLGVGKSRVTKVVKGLEEKRFVKRQDDPEDGRVKLLSLTKEGVAKMKEIDSLINTMHTRVLANIEPQQRSSVMAYLELLWTAMETTKREFGMGRK